MMSYNFIHQNLKFNIQYFLSNENCLACVFEVENNSKVEKRFTLYATNIYGFVQEPWWGCDGVTSVYDQDMKSAINKIWAYGDIFTLGSDSNNNAYKSTPDEKEWDDWIRTNDLSNNEGASIHFPIPGTCEPDKQAKHSLYNMLSYKFKIKPGKGMQVHTPRSVLGEAMYDGLCLSYADAYLAKDVTLGTFTDAISPNVPCCREDGSVNMTSAGGTECGTGPIWGIPLMMMAGCIQLQLGVRACR